MSPPDRKHAENVQKLVDRLRDQDVPAEHEEGVVIVTSNQGNGHHTTATISEHGVSTGRDVVLDPIEQQEDQP